MNYDGEQTEQSIISTMKDYLSLPSHLIKNVNDYRYVFRKNDRPIIIGVFQNENDHIYQLFVEYAFSHRKTFQFGHTFEKIPGLDDVQAPAIVLQHHPDVRSKYEKEKFIFNQVIKNLMLEIERENVKKSNDSCFILSALKENRNKLKPSSHFLCIPQLMMLSYATNPCPILF